MKKIRIFAVLALLAGLLFLQPAFAVNDPYAAVRQKPALTEPIYAAMLFYKLSGQVPDFDGWARQTGQDTAALRSTYSLLTHQDSVMVEMPVRLSAYSIANKGFLIQNIRQDMFFPFRYAGQAYALVPLGILDRQWMAVSDEAAAKIIDDANLRGGLTLVLMLQPKYADPSAPASLEGQDYWLISANVQKLMLFSPNSDAPVWQSDDTRAEDLKRQELLKLRK